MKYSQIVSMPSAVSNWLEEQLEARGIDAVVYTRYILSLLHSDAVDVIYSDEDLHSYHLKKEVKKLGGSRKRFRSSSDWWQYVQTEAEKLKRSAAVECLMSASEQTCGIESLVDELCEKLNEINSDGHNVDPPTEKNNIELQQVSPQELAKRYYAAFPPLDRNASASPSKLLYLIPKWIVSSKKKINSSRIKQQTSDTKMKTTKYKASVRRFGTYYCNRNNKKETVDRQVDDDWNSHKKSSTEETAVPKCNETLSMDEDANMYDDLPVDIQELLDDSPIPHDDTVDLMNLANMRDTGRRGFIPSGTNIISSIWTNEVPTNESPVLFDNTYNPPVAPDAVLDFQFNSFSIKTKSDWDNFSYPWEERNVFIENANRRNPEHQSWSTDSGCFEDAQVSSQYSLSLLKLNHTKSSAFAEFIPKNHSKQYNPFSKIVGSGIYCDTKPMDYEKENDDLLTSVRSHFRPINEKVDNNMQKLYADGTTFIVTNTWDKINYRRSESGSMYMENDFTMKKKYCEYKMMHESKNVEFIVKYLVCQNDKSCQTDDVDAEVEAINSERQLKEERRQLWEERRNNNKQTLSNCTCRTLATKTDYSFGTCPAHPNRPDSSILAEANWQLQSCDSCSNNSSLWTTNTDGLKRDVEWQFGTMNKIWSGGVVCHSCLGRPPSTLQHSKLREDVSQDGDQLLSDLSSIQKSYMQESLPLTEFTCDISEFLVPKERKRRHSLMATQTEDWSFASRLEEDCLIQMSTLPTLRSVTL